MSEINLSGWTKVATFKPVDGDHFAADRAAKDMAEECGFCVGPMQRDEPRALMYEFDYVAKWRNLSMDERRTIHGAILRPAGGDGPRELWLGPKCPTIPGEELAAACGRDEEAAS